MDGDRSVASVTTMEIAVALIVLAFGALVAYDSLGIGARWGEDGPQAGYVPFYIGLLICCSALAIILRALRDAWRNAQPFVTVRQLRLILTVLLPTAAYVAVISWLGLYVASALYVGLFMWWLGRYSWLMALAVSIGLSLAFFVTFEVWFGVPLPKGPLEATVGFG